MEYSGQSPTAGTVEVDTYDATTGLISGRLVFDAEAVTNFQPMGLPHDLQAASFEHAWVRDVD